MSVHHSSSEEGQHVCCEKDKVRADDDVEDEDPVDIGRRLFDAIHDDDKKKFLSTIQQGRRLFLQRGQEILATACEQSAYDCASALVKGETPLAVDINGYTPDKCTVLHHAIYYSCAGFIELLLCHGARADLRCCCWGPRHGPQLPLYYELYLMSCAEAIEEWTHEDSIFKLLTSICLPRFQDYLVAARMLACNTKDKEIEEEILECAKDGQIAMVAALLVVAHKKLNDSIGTVLTSLLSLHSNSRICSYKKEALMLLFEVFERAGDAIEAYVKQIKIGVTVQQTSKDVACLLQEAGFAVNRADTDLTRCAWFRREDFSEIEWSNMLDEDSHKPHYGKSGYRWKLYASLREAYRRLHKKVIERKIFREKDNDPLSMKGRLVQTLINDDKQEFLSIIDKSRSLFHLRGQEILEKACEYRALECATMLVKGETTLLVCINSRTSDKMFPIHHAAKTCHPSITELLLYYGARADARADVHSVYRPTNHIYATTPRLRKRLPLYLPLYEMSRDIKFEEWGSDKYPDHSIFNLLTHICLPKFQNHLETVELLARSTKDREIGREFLQCLRDGELPHMAALLLVAREKLVEPVETLVKLQYSRVGNVKIREEKKMAIQLLHEVFVRAGDAIQAYAKQGKIGVTAHQTSEDVSCLLQKAGFSLNCPDTDFSGYSWFRYREYEKNDWRCEPEDIGMPHYGKSGFRWKTYGNPIKPYQILGKNYIDQRKCFHSQAGGVLPSSKSGYISETGVLACLMGKVMGEVSVLGALRYGSPNKPRMLLAFARKGFMKHMTIRTRCLLPNANL